MTTNSDTTTSSKDPEWDRWFEVQYETTRYIRNAIKHEIESEHPLFQAAVYAGIIESLAEDMRTVMQLPHHPLRRVLRQIQEASLEENQTETQRLANIDQIIDYELT